jgi:hypothetical protein
MTPGDSSEVGSPDADPSDDTSPDTDSLDADSPDDTTATSATAADEPSGGDTFGVGIRVTESEFRFVVHVPAEIDSGWTDPDAFQRRIEAYTWEELDKRTTLGRIAETAATGDTVTLGTVTMRPDGTVTASSLSVPDE